MRRFWLGLAIGTAIIAQGPYRVLKTVKIGGTGGYDYVDADVEGRRVYFARTGAMPRIEVYNLDTLEAIGQIPSSNAHGAVVDPKSGHGFASSKPILMFDSKDRKSTRLNSSH